MSLYKQHSLITMKKESDTVQGLEGYSREDILDRVQEHFEYLLEGTDIDAQIVDMRVIGSRANGKASKGSDLDVLLEYKGSASEYGLFNILNNVDDKLYIDGIPVDINPITEGKSGTIAQFLARNHILDQMESFKRVTGIALKFKAGRPFFDGDIYLDGTKAEYIPDNLRVHGGLFIWDSEISSLPQGLTLDSLSLDNTRVSTLPRDLQVSNVILMNGKEYRTSLQTITKQGFIDLEKAGLPLMSEKSEDDTLSSETQLSSVKDVMEIREAAVLETLGEMKSYKFDNPIHVYQDTGIADDYITGINVERDNNIVLEFSRIGLDGSSATNESRRGEYDLSDLDKVLDALQDIKQKEIVRVDDDEERVSVKMAGTLETIEFERLHGWTHTEPALIWNNTEIEVFFYDSEKNSVEIIDGESGIDAYEDRRGFFLLRSGEADEAFRQLHEHDMEWNEEPKDEYSQSSANNEQQRNVETIVNKERAAELFGNFGSDIQDYKNELKSKMHLYHLKIDFTDGSLPLKKEIICAEEESEAIFDARQTFDELCKEDKLVKSAILFDMEQQKSIQKFERPNLPELLKMNSVEIRLEYELDKRAFYQKVSELHDSGYTLDWEELGIPVPLHNDSTETSSRSVAPPLSPIIQQYVGFKKSMPDVVPLFHVSGGYETYQGDADRVSKVLDIPVQESATHLGPDEHPAKYVSFPETGSVAGQETPMSKILATGLPIAILEDMNKVKGKDVPQSEERSNNVNRDLGRDEERDQSRGFHR